MVKLSVLAIAFVLGMVLPCYGQFIEVTIGETDTVGKSPHPECPMGCHQICRQWPYIGHYPFQFFGDTAGHMFFRPQRLGLQRDSIVEQVCCDGGSGCFSAPVNASGVYYGIGISDSTIRIRPKVSVVNSRLAGRAYVADFPLDLINNTDHDATFSSWRLVGIDSSLYSLTVTSDSVVSAEYFAPAYRNHHSVLVHLELREGPFWSDTIISTSIKTDVHSDVDSTFTNPLFLRVTGVPKDRFVHVTIDSGGYFTVPEGYRSAMRLQASFDSVIAKIDMSTSYPFQLLDTVSSHAMLQGYVACGPATSNGAWYDGNLSVRWNWKDFSDQHRTEQLMIPLSGHVLPMRFQRYYYALVASPADLPIIHWTMPMTPATRNVRVTSDSPFTSSAIAMDSDSVRVDLGTHVLSPGTFAGYFRVHFDIQDGYGDNHPDSIDGKFNLVVASANVHSPSDTNPFVIPNPAHESFTLYNESATDVWRDVKIFDLLGRTIISGDPHKPIITKDLASGVYILQLHKSNSIWIQSVIVSHR